MRRKGFTLVEILVVVAIMGVLAAVLLGVFSRVRENGRRTNCSDHLKQLGIAIMQYTQDYDESFPNVWYKADGVNRVGGWVFYSVYDEDGFDSKFDVTRGSLFPYAKSAQIYVCPSDVFGQKSGNSYTMNQVASASCVGGFCFGRRLSAVKNATTNVLMVAGQDAAGASTNDGAGIGCMLEAEPSCNTGTWHFNGENALHVDGHVKWYTWRTFTAD